MNNNRFLQAVEHRRQISRNKQFASGDADVVGGARPVAVTTSAAEVKSDAAAVLIPLDSIVVERQIRRDFSELESLVADIRKRGQRTPVEVSVMEQGRYRLETGECRLRALKILAQEDSARFSLVKARIVDDVQDDLARLINQINENDKRKQLKPSELGRAFQQIITHTQWDQATAAVALSVSAAYMSRYLALAKAPVEIQHAVDAGEISMSAFMKNKSLSVAPAVSTVTLDNAGVGGETEPAARRESRIHISEPTVKKMCQLLQLLAQTHSLSPIDINRRATRRDLMAILEARTSDVLAAIKRDK